MANGNKVTYSIATESVIKIILILLAVGFFWLVRDILALLFVCLIISSSLDPTVDHLQKYKIPRSIGTIIIYVVFFSIFSSVIVGISGPIATEVKTIAEEFPSYYRDINDNIMRFQDSSFLTTERVNNLKGGLDQTLINLTQMASKNVFDIASAVFGGLVTFLLALVMIFHFTVHEGAVKQFIVWLVPKGKEEKTTQLIEKIQTKLGGWLRGQFLLSVIIFIITYVGLKILGVKYALVLALLAGLFEVVPYMGPLLSAVPAIFLTLISPWGGFFKAIMVLVLYVIVQQVENNIVVPKVMSRTVGLNPLLVIIAILIGAKVSGILGALMAVPVATALTVYLHEQGRTKELVV